MLRRPRTRHPDHQALIRKMDDTPVPTLIDEGVKLGERLLLEKIKAHLPGLVDDLMRQLGEDDTQHAGGGKAEEVLPLQEPPARRVIPGSYMDIVREALLSFATDTDGADAVKVLGEVRRNNPVSTVTVDRVRGVLKVLARSGEAYRTGRGKYKPIIKPEHVGNGAHVQH